MKGVSEALNLKPCPFCGSDDLDMYAGRYRDEYQIYCEECGGRVGFYKSREEAIEHWNRRSRKPELKPCPFCGSACVLVDMTVPEAYTPKCLDCGATLPHGYPTEEEAIARWNSREEVKAQSRPLAYAPEMNDPLTVWTLLPLQATLNDARDTARKLLARIDSEEACDE